MKVPIRTCTGCGAKRPKNKMIRVGAGVNEWSVVSGPGKVPGRGTYLCMELNCLDQAMKKGGLSRSLRRRVDEELIEEIERFIRNGQKVSIE